MRATGICTAFAALTRRPRRKLVVLFLGAAGLALSGCYYPPPPGLGYPGYGYYGGQGSHHGGYGDYREGYHGHDHVD